MIKLLTGLFLQRALSGLSRDCLVFWVSLCFPFLELFLVLLIFAIPTYLSYVVLLGVWFFAARSYSPGWQWGYHRNGQQ